MLPLFYLNYESESYGYSHFCKLTTNVSNISYNLFFDLFGVLIGADPSTVIHYVATQTEIPYHLARDILYGDPMKRLERNDISFKQYFSDIQYALPSGEKLQYETFKARWDRIGLSELPATGLLPELSKKHKILILSNASNHNIRYLKSKFDFFKFVDGVITSEDAGMMKPQAGIYSFALQKFKADPDRSVMIDDSLSNVRAAIDFGMTGHYYTHFEELEQFLNDLSYK